MFRDYHKIQKGTEVDDLNSKISKLQLIVSIYIKPQ